MAFLHSTSVRIANQFKFAKNRFSKQLPVCISQLSKNEDIAERLVSILVIFHQYDVTVILVIYCLFLRKSNPVSGLYRFLHTPFSAVPVSLSVAVLNTVVL